MFYDTKTNDHKLPHDPYMALIAPRPIGWISSLSENGIANLAPYSFFNGVGANPKMLMFSSDGIKDSATNIAASGEFTFNIVSDNLKDEMYRSSTPCPAGVSEFEYANIESAPGELVKCPRVASAYASMECKVLHVINPIDLNGDKTNNHIFIGQVVGIHISEDAVRDGRFDLTVVKPVSRLGYLDFATVTDVYGMGPMPQYSNGE